MGKYENKWYFGVKRRVFEVDSLEEGLTAILRGEEAVRFDWVKVNIGPDGAKKVPAKLKNNRTLELLDLWSNEIGDAGAGSLAEALKVNSTLSYLNLRSNDIGPEGTCSLAEALKVNRKLTTLDLEGNEVGDAGAGLLAESLKVNSTLITLHVGGNKIGDAGAGSLAEALKVNRTLTTLNLEGNNIRPQGAGSLAEALKFNSALTTLNLWKNEIGDVGAGSLAEALKVNSTLTTLDLYNNNIGPKGADLLANALKVNCTLTYLNLCENNIGPEGAGLLAEALKVNRTLTTLNLSWNNIGPEGAGSLAEALKRNSTLTRLDLGNNEIGDAGAGSLAEALKVNSTLTELHLGYNNIGPEGADSLAEALKVNSTLTTLNVSHNNLNLESHVYLAACASFQVQDGVNYEDDRVRAAQGHGIRARQLGLSPSRVPQEVLDRDSYSNASNTKTYLEGLLFSEDAVHQLKVLVVGPQKVGKTSLRRALKKKGLEADPTQEDDADRATISVDIDEVKFEALAENEKGGKISLWDFGGQEEYYMTHAFFLSNRSLVMVVVDLQAYEDDEQSFEDCAGKWLRALQMQIFRPKVLLVGTKCDTQSKEEIEAKMASLQQRVDELGLKVREAIMEKAKGLPKEEQELQRLGSFEGLTFTGPRSFVVSGVDVSQGDGVANLYDFLRELASNTDKGIALRVPKAFEDLRELIKRKREEENQLVQSIEDLQQEAGLEEQDTMFRLALGLLHDLGIILWYEKSEQLADVVFSDPKWVVEIVRQVFRHDLFERREGDKKEGVLYDLESDETVNLTALQKMLKNKCILDERLLKLFPMWKTMDSEMFDRCLNLLQQFELMYKISSKKEERLPRQYMVPLFLRTGFVGSVLRKVSLESKRRSVSKRISRSISSLSRGIQILTTSQTYNFFAFIPDGFLFRVIARTFRIAEFTKLSEEKATAEYKHNSGICIDVEITSQVKSDGSGDFSITCSCLSTSERAMEILERTQALFVDEVNQLLDASFRFVPFESAVVTAPTPEHVGGAKKRNSVPRRNGSLYVCQDADDFSYFAKKKKVIELKLKEQNRYMIKRYCLDAISQQLEKVGRTADHLIKVGKDIRGKLKRNFHFSLNELEEEDPVKERLLEFESQHPDEKSLTCQQAEIFLKLVRQFLSRLRTEFDCFLAHKWGEGGLNHKAVVQLKEKLEKNGLKCWVDSSEMKSNIGEMLTGIDKSQTFVACVTEDYIDAVKEDDSYCETEYSHAVGYKSKCDLLVMFMDEEIADPDYLQGLPKAAWKLYCSSESALFNNVLQQLFPHDEVASRPKLLKMYPACPSP